MNWSEYEGRWIANWRLESFLGARDGRAFFVAGSQPQKQPVLMQVMVAGGPEAQSVRASWDRAKTLSHDHLLTIHDTGETQIDSTRLFYAISDLPDDDLGEKLGGSMLPREDATRIFSEVASGLDYLHGRGLRHGAVVPSNVFLLADKVALSGEAIAPASSGDKESDLKQFGSTLVSALTGRTDLGTATDVRRSETIAQLGTPFSQVAIGCLDDSEQGKWTAARVVDVLSGRAAPVLAAPASEESAVTPAPQAIEDVRSAAQPPFTQPAMPGGKTWRIAAIIALPIGLILLLWILFRPARVTAPVATTHAVAVPQPAPAVAQRKPDPTIPIPIPARRPEAGPRKTAQKLRSVPVTRGASNWAVIAATYLNFGSAAKRAEHIRKTSRGLHPHVFPAQGKGGKYYVILGSGLSQTGAQELLRKARSTRAPRDTYITKLDEK